MRMAAILRPVDRAYETGARPPAAPAPAQGPPRSDFAPQAPAAPPARCNSSRATSCSPSTPSTAARSSPARRPSARRGPRSAPGPSAPRSARAAGPPVPPGPARPRAAAAGAPGGARAPGPAARPRPLRPPHRPRRLRPHRPAGHRRRGLRGPRARRRHPALSGYHRTASDLLHDLFAAVYNAPAAPPRPGRAARPRPGDRRGRRPGRPRVRRRRPRRAARRHARVRLPDRRHARRRPPRPPTRTLEEVFLGGLAAPRAGTAGACRRPRLTEEEADWAGDLWFESEGLPLRFVQAGAPCCGSATGCAPPAPSTSSASSRTRPRSTRPSTRAVRRRMAADERPAALARRGRRPRPAARRPAQRLGPRDPAAGRRARRRGAAPGAPARAGRRHPRGRRPGRAGRPAAWSPRPAPTTGSPPASGPSWRPPDTAMTPTAQAHTAAQHYAWWAGHPSVTPERVSRRGRRGARRAGRPRTGHHARRPRARTAPPCCWPAQRRPPSPPRCTGAPGSGRCGPAQEAARLAGEVAEEAYFHHELGVLALAAVSSTGRGPSWRPPSACAVRSPTSAARSPAAAPSRWSPTAPAARCPASPPTAGAEVPDATVRGVRSRPPGGVPAAFPPLQPPADSGTLVTYRSSSATAVPPGPFQAPARARPRTGHGRPAGLARRNLVAAGAGALLAAVLGTVVTLGVTSDNEPTNRPTR